MVERHLAKVDTAVRFCSLALKNLYDSKEGFNSNYIWFCGVVVYLVSLSRRRSRVRISSEPPFFCECSSMVERHLAKVDTAVRFCSLALKNLYDSKEGFNSNYIWFCGVVVYLVSLSRRRSRVRISSEPPFFCECSSMVERHLAKVDTAVRFCSLALLQLMSYAHKFFCIKNRRIFHSSVFS